MREMFYRLYLVKNLDVSKFDTKSVRTMMGMFDFCESLTSIDLNTFDTSNVEDMSFMFAA